MHLTGMGIVCPVGRKDGNSGFLKTLLIMRFLMFFMLAGSLQLSARGVAQTISLSEKNAPLETVLKSIKKQSGYAFFYNYSILEKSRPVTVQLKAVSLKEALDACFKNQPLTWSIQGKLVTVMLRPEADTAVSADYAVADITVTGVVRDSLGNPIPDITVSVRGKKSMTRTDANGRFSIKASPGDVLVFSSVSYEMSSVTVTEDFTNITVRLLNRVDKLTAIEVVPTGYQFVKKSNMVGAVSTIKASELYFDGTTTLEQALQGKLPGVVVTNPSGLVGVRQQTRVRGTSTLFGNQDPVWVVDGIIQQDPLPFKATALDAVGGITKDNFDFVRDYVGNAISWLNPQDIEDITVLKDAAATAIYGIRAGNGVIVINTKKGNPGPVTVGYNFSINMAERVTYDRLELMNSKERIAVSKEIFDRGLVSSNANTSIGYAGALNDYLFGRISYEEFNRLVRYYETLNTDWFDILFRQPVSTNHNLSFSGGNAFTRYYASVGYINTLGTARGNESKGYTGSLGINTRIGNKFDVGIKISASQRTTQGFYKTDPYGYASVTNRVIPAYDNTGAMFYYPQSGGSGYLFNVLNELDNTSSNNRVLNANTNINVQYHITNNLTFRTQFSYSSSATTGYTYATERTNYIAGKRWFDYGTAQVGDEAYTNSQLPKGGEYNQDNNQSSSVNWRNDLSWSKVFNKKHAVTVLLGEEISSTQYKGYSETIYGYLRDRGQTFTALPLTYTKNNTPNPLLNMPHVIRDNVVNNIGLYLSGSYSYNNRYVVNASVRSDASNRFGQDTRERFNPVWAGGVRWNIGNENWFTKTYWLSDFSFRASFGFQRNLASNFSPDLIARIPSSPPAFVTDQFTGENLLAISNLPYADLRWEKNTSINLGWTLGLFNNKIQASVDYYQKTGKDIITFLTVPLEYGVDVMPINGGSLTNRGIEIGASFVPVLTKNFTWSVSMTTSKNFNEITKSGLQTLTWRTAVSGSMYHEGYPVSGFWAFDFQGIDPATGYPIINLQTKAGSDSLNDPASYMKYMGKLDPDFVSGLGMSFRYKKLTLNASFYLQVGGKKFLAPAITLSNSLPSEYENLSRELVGRWTPDNVNATLPGMPDNTVANLLLPNNKTYTNVYEMYRYSTARVVSASTLRCNNISLGYSLPAKLLSKLHIKNATVGAGVSAPFAIVSSDFKGRDPEVATGGQPRTRSYSLSLNVGF